MSTFYAEMAQVAIDLINEYGRDIPWTRTDADTFVVTSGMFRGLRVDPRRYIIPDPTIQMPDHRMILDNKVEPKENDRVDGNLIVTRVTNLKPADLTLVYMIDLRNG